MFITALVMLPGTERSYVVTDYIEMMNKGSAAAGPVITDILAKLIGGKMAPPDLSLVRTVMRRTHQLEMTCLFLILLRVLLTC